MTMNDFLAHSKFFPEALNHEILLKISSFLLYALRFKNDILLAQASSWPAGNPPMFLPQSVVILLSHLCDMDEKSTNGLWSYLKDAVWRYQGVRKKKPYIQGTFILLRPLEPPSPSY